MRDPDLGHACAMLIRREVEADVAAIDGVHGAAFPAPESGGQPIEVGLVHALRSDPGWIPALSLVAELDNGTVIGHVVCTLGTIAAVGVADVAGGPDVAGVVSGAHAAGGAVVALGLGPIGVLPEQQGLGVGSALMHAVLGGADALGYPAVVLLGHVDYYPRFGFVPARTLGISPTMPEWGDHFQALALSNWTPATRGVFRYAAPFDDL